MHDNEKLIRQAFALQNAHKADELAGLYAADARFNDVPLGAFLQDPDEMKKLWVDTWAAVSGFRMDPGSVVVDERGGAAEFIMTGTHVGDFPGFPATGKSVSIKGASIVRIVDGQIAEWTDYWSTGDMPH